MDLSLKVFVQVHDRKDQKAKISYGKNAAGVKTHN